MPVLPEQVFSSAVSHYARYRTGYPDAEIAALADRLGLDGSQTVVDIGCGPGTLSLPIAQRAARVIAVDPVPGMLATGERRARATGVTNITWVQGDAAQLDQLVPGGAHVATFAAPSKFTYSVSTPAVFGNRAQAFADDVRAAVLTLHPNGQVAEPFRVEVLIARQRAG